MDSCIDSFTKSIRGQTPIFSGIIPAGFKAESVYFSHSFSIFHPRYSWSWVPSGSAMKSCIRSLNNSLICWSWIKAWWNWNIIHTAWKVNNKTVSKNRSSIGPQVTIAIMLLVLTLDIKIGASIDSRFHPILCRTPVLSRLSSIGFKTQCVSFSHSYSIFSPRYLWRWISSGSTLEG